MKTKLFTLVKLGNYGHATEAFYGTRADAEKRLDQLGAEKDILAVYLYGTETGGFINSVTPED
jgi:hypothetical protein